MWGMRPNIALERTVAGSVRSAAAQRDCWTSVLEVAECYPRIWRVGSSLSFGAT